MIETLCGGDPRTVERVRQRVRAMVGNLDVFQLRPGIDGLLRRLRERGLKLGIVANQPEAARERLARGIGDLFDSRHQRDHRPRKPDPRAFLAAAEALGVAPAECIMVGDRIDNDIAPAKALGMATIQFRSGRHRRQRPRSAAERAGCRRDRRARARSGDRSLWITRPASTPIAHQSSRPGMWRQDSGTNRRKPRSE